jgi:UDP-N-acetylglucosamine 2-epimerase
MKVMTILGTRPEIIKLAALIPLLQRFEHVLVHTGQHYDHELDADFFKELDLPEPRYNLKIGSGLQGKQTGRMIEKLEEVMLAEKPDVVIVLGDTNTTLAGTLAATKLHLKLIHVEAGCRSFNRTMPEEMNRIIADHCADYLLAADMESVEHLRKEGLTKNVSLVGNTIFDACLRNKELAAKSRVLEEIGLTAGKYILATIHRSQSTDDPKVLRKIMESLEELTNEIEVVVPLHPRTKKALEKFGITLGPKVKVIKPQGYLPFLKLLENSRFCVTDSGGIQDECLFFNVPAIIPREETEWVRLVKAGKNFLVGHDGIVEKAQELLNDEELLRVNKIEYPYETGVAQKIVNIIEEIK